jgi:hypothetical protein
LFKVGDEVVLTETGAKILNDVYHCLSDFNGDLVVTRHEYGNTLAVIAPNHSWIDVASNPSWFELKDPFEYEDVDTKIV